MNIRPWHDETTLPLPLLTGVAHAREFAQTEAFVHPHEAEDPYCRAMDAAHANMVKADELRAAGQHEQAAWLAGMTMQAATALTATESLFQARFRREAHQQAAGCSACNGNCPTPAACELPIAQATKPPRAAFWLLRAITAIRLAFLRWNLDCLRDERDHYRALGWVGPVYMRNSWQEELRLRRAIRELES